MAKIKKSLEWPAIETDLLHKAVLLSNGHDIYKMIKNIQSGVTELSRAEVLARRGQRHKAEEILARVNNDIEMVEEYLLIATLLG